jgi:N-acetylglucosaminyldiphosphoundecaprenol N-acetyl-beta-D-mannosaminyltransferase
MQQVFDRTEILGVNVDVISLDDLFSYSFDSIREKKKVVFSYVNVNAVNLAYNNPTFRKIINSSHVIFCDGFGVKWLVRLIKRRNLHRLTPTDWFDSFAYLCAEQGFSMFFLGTQQESIKNAVIVIKGKFPNLKILGAHHGYFNKAKESSENQKVIQMINDLRPDVLVVGFGMPIQEKWISENVNDLDTHVIVPVGAFFDYLTKEVIRAPRWMTNNGLEWLGRLIIEPDRLWKRYLVGNPLFLWRAIKHYILKIPLPGEALEKNK